MKSDLAKIKRKREDEAEMELRQAVLEMPRSDGPREICPSIEVLRRFGAGSVSEETTRAQIVAHLDVCTRCIEAIVQICKQRRRSRRLALALAAVVLLATILWIWPAKSPPHSVSVIADLSVAAPARSNHHIDMPSIKVGADTHQLRVILPQLSAEGIYEVAVFAEETEDVPILRKPTSASMKDHHLELKVDMDFSRMRPGNYLLAVRHGDSNWEYVPLVRE